MLILHIAGASAWLGANVMQGVVPPLIAREGVAPAAAWYRIAAQLGKRLYIPASLLIVGTGIVMVLDDDAIGFGTMFVTVGFAMVVVGAILGSAVFERGSNEAADAMEAGDRDRIKRATSRLTRWGMVDTVLLLFTITVMVLRWRI